MNNSTNTSKSSGGKGCLVVLLIFTLIIAMIILIIKLLVTPSDFKKEQLSSTFIPQGNQLLIEEDLINEMLMDLIPENEMVEINEIFVDSKKDEVIFFVDMTLSSMNALPLMKRDISSSVYVDVEIKPYRDSYQIGLKKLKIGRIPVPLFMFSGPIRKLLNNQFSINTTANVFEYDLSDVIEDETGLKGIEQMIIREEGFLLIINPESLGLPISNELLNSFSGDVNGYINKNPDLKTSSIGQVLLNESSQVLNSSIQNSSYVTYLEGVVQSRRNDSIRDLTFGDVLEEGDLIMVDSDSFCEILLPDSSLIKVQENSVLLLSGISGSANQHKILLGVEKGSLMAKVDKIINENSSFDVHIGSTVMGIRGTQFLVDRKARGFSIFLLEGKVDLKNGNQALSMTPGQLIKGTQSLMESPLDISDEELLQLQKDFEWNSSAELLEAYQQGATMSVFNSALRIYREYEKSSAEEQEQMAKWAESFMALHPEYQQELEKMLQAMDL